MMHYPWCMMWPRIPVLDVRNASKTVLIKVSKPTTPQTHKISTLWRPLPSRQRPWKNIIDWAMAILDLEKNSQKGYFCHLVYPQPLIGCLGIDILCRHQCSDHSEPKIPMRSSIQNAQALAPGFQQPIRFQRDKFPLFSKNRYCR